MPFKSMLLRLISLLIATLMTAPAQAAADRYEFDKSHTNILFFVSHIGFSEMAGKFTDYDGHFLFDQEKPENSKVEVNLKPAGIKTSSEALDDHLQKPDWFNSEKFPEITFQSARIKVTGKNTGEIIGNVSMLGVTKPVTLRVTFNKADYHPMTQDYVAGFTAEAKLKRSDFGMTNAIPMVGDDVRIWISAEGVNTTRKQQLEKRR